MIEIEEDFDEVIDNRAAILVRFEYPLTRPVIAEFFNPVGSWTRRQLIGAVIEKYKAIYAEEEASLTIPVGVEPGLYNRNRTDGVHGIWGHDLTDLILCGFHKGEDGIYELDIES